MTPNHFKFMQQDNNSWVREILTHMSLASEAGFVAGQGVIFTTAYLPDSATLMRMIEALGECKAHFVKTKKGNHFELHFPNVTNNLWLGLLGESNYEEYTLEYSF